MAYIVVGGDTLNKIAARNNTTLAELLRLNPQFRDNPDLIRPGQTVNLPGDSGGSSGSGGGGSGSAPTGTGLNDDTEFGSGAGPDTGNEGIRFADLPGRPEVWQKTDGSYLVVYLVPGVEPEIPMIWDADEDDVKMLFDDEKIVVDATVTDEQLVNAGALPFGAASEIELRGENPFSGWASQFERQKEVLPWLEDPEVSALFASSWLEGREPTEAELASTDWFKSKTAGEQQWLSTQYAQPETAKQIQQDSEIATKNQMIAAGILNPPSGLVNYLAEQVYTGKKTDVWLQEQVAKLADPAYDGELDGGVASFIKTGKLKIDTTMEGERYVTETAIQWLGSAFGTMSDAQVQRWAGIIRNDPDGEDQFIKHLKQQRLALFPEYDNENLTYEDIAQPWRNFATNAWGQNLNDDDAVLQHLIRTNDSAEAATYLRGEGLKRGVKKVEDDFVSNLTSAAQSSAGVKTRI